LYGLKGEQEPGGIASKKKKKEKKKNAMRTSELLQEAFPHGRKLGAPADLKREKDTAPATKAYGGKSPRNQASHPYEESSIIQ